MYVLPWLKTLEVSSKLEKFNKYNEYTKHKKKLIGSLTTLSELKIKKIDYLKFINPDILKKYASVYTEAILYMLHTFEQPEDYIYLKYAYIISEYIKTNMLLYDDKCIKIQYNPFTQFGRFGLLANSFNILSFKKEDRIKLKPISNDYIFVEFDYNAFEIRTLFALLKIKQPIDDLYEVLYNTHKNSSLSRMQFKKMILQSLYSQHEETSILGSLLQKKNFYNLYPIINGKVKNIFGKLMDTDSFHLLSRILQSSAAYILYTQIFNVIRYINENNLKSVVSFCIHDSICLSLHKTEITHLQNIKDIIQKVNIPELNYISDFPVSIKTGTNYGEMIRYET